MQVSLWVNYKVRRAARNGNAALPYWGVPANR
jgi:hypothetical protein